ncbi:uncharacterized protein LOC6547446 isoform X2 [Drosophila erecta]|uniref:Odorant-binding protein 56i, isoform B n=1 Tax=Drosophila erecta TaxID=7220 RepID=A0A0Q5W047_DROER|nr:uncharacterized protein LOC6547446 isoform X2 [Drosophila erecta]KQS62207.1 Odorant-binding protein 56i, isoform B [Drosophila erecta]
MVVCVQRTQVQAGPIKEKCMVEVGITAQDVADRHLNDDPGDGVKLFLENIGIIADNKIIPGAFGQVLGHLITEEAVERMDATCNLIESETSDEESCELAWQISECYEGLRMSDARQHRRTRKHRG